MMSSTFILSLCLTDTGVDLNLRMEPVSRELPLDISELTDTLIKNVNVFISQFDSREVRMKRTVRDFQEMAEKVRKMQEKSNRVRTAVAVGAGVAVFGFFGLIGLFFARVTEGLSLVLTAIAAAVGGIVVVCASIKTLINESVNAGRVAKLGTDFTSIIEPMKRSLQEIKMVCEELKLKSFEVQAEQTLNDMVEFTMITTITVVTMRGERRGASSASLETFIILSADQSEKVINELKKMKDKVSIFTDHCHWTLLCNGVLNVRALLYQRDTTRL